MSSPVHAKPRSQGQAGHGDVVTSVAFTPDGRSLASGSWDGTVRIWDVQGGRLKPRQTLRGEWDEVEAVAFSPDGSAVAGVGTGFDGEPFGVVTLWAIGARRGRTLVREPGKIDAIAFAPDGATLAVASGDRRVVTLRDASTGAEREVLVGHRGPIWSVAYSPDGRTLAAASGVVPAMSKSVGDGAVGEVCLWDLSGPAPHIRGRLGGHEHGVIAVAFSPDGASLASGGFDRVAKLWRAEATHERATLAGHKGWVSAVAFAPDGAMVATGSHDQTIKLWDAATGREIDTLTGHTGNVYAVAFSPDGSLLASGSLDGTVRLWDVDRPPGAAQAAPTARRRRVANDLFRPRAEA